MSTVDLNINITNTITTLQVPSLNSLNIFATYHCWELWCLLVENKFQLVKWFKAHINHFKLPLDFGFDPLKIFKLIPCEVYIINIDNQYCNFLFIMEVIQNIIYIVLLLALIFQIFVNFGILSMGWLLQTIQSLM